MSFPPRDPAAQARAAAPLAIIFWILWASMTTGVVLIRFLISPGARGRAAESGSGGIGPIEILCVGVALASVVLRWLVLPRVDSLQKKLPVFIAALAMAESCGLLGTILARSHQLELFVLSLVALALLAPVFALPRSAGFPRADS
jgi:hypothetical protein